MPRDSFLTTPLRLRGLQQGAFVALLAAIVLAMVCGHAGVRTPLAASLIAIAVLAWRLDSDSAAWLYIATLGIQVPQDVIVFRVAVSDLILLPVIARTALAVVTGRHRLRSSFNGPIAVVLLAFLLANIVGFVAGGGRLSFWSLFNKDLGLAYLVCAFYALRRQLDTPARMRAALGVFVLGVSVTNALALVFAVISATIWSNTIYMMGSYRLNGWMQNPSANGALLLVAACLELPRLAEPAQQGRFRAVRWINYALLVIAIAMTLSRSIWLSTGAAGGTLFLLGVMRRMRGMTFSYPSLAAAFLTAAMPALSLGWIATQQWQRMREISQDTAVARADELRKTLIDQCLVNWQPELCDVIPRDQIEAARAERDIARAGEPDDSPPAAGGSGQGRPGRPGAAGPRGTARPGGPGRAADAPASPAPPLSQVTVTDPEGAMMNTRGLGDRVAIIRIAMRKYQETIPRQLLGIGIGRFYAESASDFGVPIIIHNSPVWFLVELGPMGLAAWVWIFGLAIMRGWRLMWNQHPRGIEGIGVLAAVAGLLIFAFFNESFYLRHFWLLLLATDVLPLETGEPS